MSVLNRTLDYIYGRPKGPLPDAVAVTRRLLGMTDESIRRDVYELIQWLRDQPDLPNTLDGGEINTTSNNNKSPKGTCKVVIVYIPLLYDMSNLIVFV